MGGFKTSESLVILAPVLLVIVLIVIAHMICLFG
jgi:hypothetical protein